MPCYFAGAVLSPVAIIVPNHQLVAEVSVMSFMSLQLPLTTLKNLMHAYLPACLPACPTQVLFRPVAMVVPDYQLVAEVMLFSEGFDAAPWLAGKMVHLYKLASEQLSQQVGLALGFALYEHSDISNSMRSSVRLLLGGWKRSHGCSVAQLVGRAMQVQNPTGGPDL
jgi:hypothetical protein